MSFNDLFRMTRSTVSSKSRSVYRKIVDFKNIYLKPVFQTVNMFCCGGIRPILQKIYQYCHMILQPLILRITQESNNLLNEVYDEWLIPVFNNLTCSTELILACKNNQIDVALQLISAGADVNTRDIYGGTPLIYACSNSLSDVAIELINHGADINMTYSNKKTTALIIACKRALPEVCKLLINNGADVNAVDADGYTPLLFASMHDINFDNIDFSDITELLIEHNADVNATALDGNYPLWNACVNNNLRICTLLVSNYSKVDGVYFGFNPLWHSCLYGHWDIARLLICNNADVNIEYFGISPLGLACAFGHIDTFLLLLERNADIHNTGLESNALHWACINPENAYIVQSLIKLGADMDKHAFFDTTPQSIDILQMFVDRDDEVGRLTFCGVTPLHVACFLENSNMSCLLIDKGADVNAKNPNNVTPLALSCRSSFMYKTVVKLINNDADINVKSFLGTPLSIACENNFDDAVLTLIDSGADINICGYDNEPIVVTACKNKLDHYTMISLIDNGASIEPILTDESIHLYEKFDNNIVKNSSATYAVMRYLKVNTLDVAYLIDTANESIETFVNACTMASEIYYMLDKAEKRMHRDVLVTDDLKSCLYDVEDLLSEQIVRLIYISKSQSQRKRDKHTKILPEANEISTGKIQYFLTIQN